jgi:large subunit ribosomal protein L10
MGSIPVGVTVAEWPALWLADFKLKRDGAAVAAGHGKGACLPNPVIGGNAMALSLEEKKAVVDEVGGVARSALSMVAAEYRGLTVAEMTDLREQARKDGVYLRVVKNTLARRALDGTEFEVVKNDLSGPLLLAFSQADPGAAARLARDFAKSHGKFVPRCAAVGGERLAAEELDRLANLPTRDQALAQLLGVMKAPIEKFVRTLAEPSAKLVRTFAAIRDQKQEHAA